MKKVFALFTALLFVGSMVGQAYKLVKVTSVQHNKMYVIEQKDAGRVLIGYSESNALKSTDSYWTTTLLGDESYVWKALDDDSDGEFVLCNMERYADSPSGHVYISNANASTNLVMSNTGSEFKFTFTGDVALIDHPNNSNRFIGETSAGAGTFKAYAAGNLSSYNHDFYVYELQEMTEPYLIVRPSEIDFETVLQGATVVSQEVEVIYGNLSNPVTYSLSAATPFTASGTIAASGDKITVAASTAAAGEFSVTLTIASGTFTAPVTLKMKVIEGTDPSAQFGEYTGAMSEGDYVITYTGRALNTTSISDTRLGYSEVVPAGGYITGPAADIIWHIAKSGEYWTLYNAAANKYAASKTAKNTATMVADGTIDNALWTVTVTDGKYDFENKSRSESANPENKWLRNNGTNGFACYAANMGGALTLYKKGAVPTAVENIEAAPKAMKVLENGQLIIIRDGVRYNANGTRVE